MISKGSANNILQKSIADEDNRLHLTKIGAKPINIAPNASIKK
tara:strand:+ start:190 stop:318 length:129 start_codon:yes stop_codon:yes gene_type:complete